MSGHRKKPNRIADPAALLGKLRTCPEELNRASSAVKPMETVYHGLSMVVVAIDAPATLLTRQERYFSIRGTTATEGELALEA